MKMSPVCILLHIAKAAMVNVALEKPASMSSSKSGYSASTAVDGNTDAAGFGTDEIINTDTGHNFAWWKVDLQRDVQNATVRIYFRTDYKTRRNGVRLYTSTSPFPTLNPTSQGQLCHTVTGRKDGSDIPDVYNVTCPGRWRYLLLYTDTDNDGQGPVLDFGEVEVWVCSDETYGEDCTKTCSTRNCVTMNTTCDRDGRCPDACKSGWTGVDCTQACANGSYGPNCNLLCSHRNCVEPSTQCNHVTGQCQYGCKPGYKGIDCVEECESGTYGNCSLSCNDRNCLVQSDECDQVTGQCEGGCQAGYQGRDCRQGCPSGTYGSNCTEKCGECDGVCDSGSGLCYEGCLDGYRGAWCNVTTDAANNNIVVVVGSVLGTLLLVVVLVGVGVLVLLFRHGRLQWVKKPDQMSHDNTELKTVVPQSNDASEQERNGRHVHTNYYNGLDPQLTAGNMDYDVIQHEEYQNV